MTRYHSLLRYPLRALMMCILIAYTFIVVGPFLWTIIMSFRSTPDILNNPYGLPIPPIFSNYVRVFTEFGFGTYFRNSSLVTLGSLVLTTIVASLAAYGFARRRFQFGLRVQLIINLRKRFLARTSISVARHRFAYSIEIACGFLLRAIPCCVYCEHLSCFSPSGLPCVALFS